MSTPEDGSAVRILDRIESSVTRLYATFLNPNQPGAFEEELTHTKRLIYAQEGIFDARQRRQR